MVADQASATEATEPQGSAQAAPPTTTTSTPPSVDYAAELARAQKEIADLRKEAASHRTARNEARSAADKAAEEQGQFKALADSYKARIAELEGLEAPAQQWA